MKFLSQRAMPALPLYRAKPDAPSPERIAAAVHPGRQARFLIRFKKRMVNGTRRADDEIASTYETVGGSRPPETAGAAAGIGGNRSCCRDTILATMGGAAPARPALACGGRGAYPVAAMSLSRHPRRRQYVETDPVESDPQRRRIRRPARRRRPVQRRPSSPLSARRMTWSRLLRRPAGATGRSGDP